MTYLSLFNQSKKILKEKGTKEAPLESLLLFAFNLSKEQFLLSLNKECDTRYLDKFNHFFNEYLDGKPVQYITNKAYFYNLELKVDERVLIPRWETEELVHYLLIYIKKRFNDKPINIIDLGTGSGAIALALKKANNNFNVFVTDIKKEALVLAEENARNNNLEINFILSDWWTNVDEKIKFDVVVSNPPYIREDEEVEALVLKEPHTALYGGKDGLNSYRDILKDVKEHLKDSSSIIAFEHGMSQKEEIARISSKYLEDYLVISFKDSMKRDRMTFIYKE